MANSIDIGKKLENLTLNDVLKFARANGFQDLLKTIEDQMIDGFVIQVIDEAAIETLFPKLGLRIKFKALIGQLKKALNEMNSDSTIIENINIQRVQQQQQQQIVRQFPIPFEFPEHRLDRILKDNLRNEAYEPKESDLKAIIDCVFKEMLEYLSVDPYPTSSQYMLAATSIIAKYPHLRTKDANGYDTYRVRLKTRFHELRRGATPSPTILAARVKYTSKAKRLRTNPYGIDDKDSRQTNNGIEEFNFQNFN